jgi:ribosomal protein S18 acetylase RimI-like enzyme
MNFSFYNDETNEVLNLINESFSIEGNSITLQENQRIILMKDENKVVGLTLISLKSDPIKKIKTFYLDYFCISKDYRNRHLGTEMFKKIESIAIEENIDYIELTSNKNRIEARSIYLNNGMEIVDTDLFRKKVINNNENV